MKQFRTYAAVGIVWLFHISGIIGMTLGYQDWFIGKTPLNLLICFILLVLVYPLDTVRKGYVVFVFFIAGLFVEWVGVSYGFLFGEYYYGENLGLKIDGVPFMIGINWAMLVLITGAIASKFKLNIVSKALIGALLMVFLDFFIEPSAPTFDFWYWSQGHPPLRNFVAWFIISFILHFIYQQNFKKGNFIMALHTYAAQLFFFAYFYGN